MAENTMVPFPEETNSPEKTAQSADDPQDPGRRQFINQALVVSGGIAMSGLIPRSLSALPVDANAFSAEMNALPAEAASAACTAVLGKELVNPGVIPSGSDGVLHAVLRLHAEDRLVSYLDVNSPNPPTIPPAVCGSYKLRAYEGYKGTKVDPSQLVTKPGVYGPGPTFNANVGDTIRIAMLNHVNPADFPETAEHQCDEVKSSSGTQIYPGKNPHPACPDHFPDCFRGSNTTNLHFHGTHVSPNAFSDNVLVEIVPDLDAKAEDCLPWFDLACEDYPNPQAWKHLDAASTQKFAALKKHHQDRLKALDKVHPEKNDPTLHSRQAAQNQVLEQYGEFPQYWTGCFPYCLRPPKYVAPPPLSLTECPPSPEPKPKYAMGQAPGTQWYHAHKHGSTSIQVFNGMSGALILRGDYDTKLNATMRGLKEKVLVLQQFQPQPNRERTGGAGGAGKGTNNNVGALVNGQLQPVITMYPNEVQLWRIINATVQFGKDAFFKCAFAGPEAPTFYQTAQDGVQLAWENYKPQIATGGAPTQFTLAPGNRVDILVRAPGSTGTAAMVAGLPSPTVPSGKSLLNLILTVKVVNPPPGAPPYNQAYPQSQDQYPEMPPFLADITEVSECRTIKYQMDMSGGPGAPPLINGRRFEEGRIDEAMLLDTRQEWTIENYTAPKKNDNPDVLHPFHIHVNPFQITEIYEPTRMKEPLKLPQPWIWWDTFPIPRGKLDENGKVIPGYFKMRTHFADFAGKYVNHCHILAHEDRGMMQLIEVVDNKTVVHHH
jgi:FtsP/CotA-like multicopper oxidase with cupredoxin domain